MNQHTASASHLSDDAHRIDPDKLLALCRKRHSDTGVRLSWTTMLQIIEQLRASQQQPKRAPKISITEAMVDAAEEAHMPFGDMRAAIEAAIAEARS
ncbi:hypothetical protein [Halomonas piscis]|uniref:hypothetical protein n=1 Tax=Halomonas piscis TaxID=3031727 RepID=UPI0028A1D0A5|nr:hypothetical protein [Halomonas piscis]